MSFCTSGQLVVAWSEEIFGDMRLATKLSWLLTKRTLWHFGTFDGLAFINAAASTGLVGDRS